MNITKLTETNYGGSLGYFLYTDVKNISVWPERDGANLLEAIQLKPNTDWSRIDFTESTLLYKEELEYKKGDHFYVPSLNGLVPKNRPELTAAFDSLRLKRIVVLHPCKNGYIWVIGSKEEPARLLSPTVEHKKFMQTNGYEIQVTTDCRFPTPTLNAIIPQPAGPSSIRVYNSNSSFSVVTSADLQLPNEPINIFVNGTLNQTASYIPLSNQTINIS
jgi:hypothetical protein